MLLQALSFRSHWWIQTGVTVRKRPIWVKFHSGETDEANCSWLHPVWPPPKRPDRDNTFCVVSRASTELIFCIHRDFVVRNKCTYRVDWFASAAEILARENHGRWSQLYLGMKPTVGAHLCRMKPTAYGWSQIQIFDELQSVAVGCLLPYNIWLYFNNILIMILPFKHPPLVALWKAMVL